MPTAGRDDPTGGWPTNVVPFPLGVVDRAANEIRAEREEQIARLRGKLHDVETAASVRELHTAAAVPTPEVGCEDGAAGAGAGEAGKAGEADAFSHEASTAEDRIAEAVTLLTRALARSAKSAHECEQLLQQHTELTGEERAEVLERMHDYGYLDDARLAEQLVTGRLARKGLGRAGKMRELRQRGLEQSVIDDALASDGASDFDIALELARKRSASLQGIEPETARRRLYGFLGRRGFSTGIISEVVQLALEPQHRTGPTFK